MTFTGLVVTGIAAVLWIAFIVLAARLADAPEGRHREDLAPGSSSRRVPAAGTRGAPPRPLVPALRPFPGDEDHEGAVTGSLPVLPPDGDCPGPLYDETAWAAYVSGGA